MLRDRCPKLVSLALKYCKVKEAWLDHVYKNFIWLYVSNKERLAATRRVLGYHDDKPREFKFEDTILWDNLTPEEKEGWENVQSWVSWFQRVVPYIENEYEISKKSGTDMIDIKQGIMLNWLYEMCPTKEDDNETREKKNKEINNLVDLLINYFEEV
jgi:hypothetical protein